MQGVVQNEARLSKSREAAGQNTVASEWLGPQLSAKRTQLHRTDGDAVAKCFAIRTQVPGPADGAFSLSMRAERLGELAGSRQIVKCKGH